MQKHSKILIPVDGSQQSLRAVGYVGRMFSKGSQIILFHVAAEVPEAFRDMDFDPTDCSLRYPLRIWKVHQQELIHAFMEKTRQKVLDSGFSNEAIFLKSQSMKSGIARDILNESQQDYSAMVVGRIGRSQLDTINMGSVAAKLVELTGHIPIIIVGEYPESKKILVAFDGSAGSMKAVTCLGTLLDPSACEVMICHVVRPLSIGQWSTKELFMQKHETDWIESNKRKIVPAIMEAKRRLIDAGFSAEHLSSEILTYQESRAGAIAKAAGKGGYHTIVLGRRGYSSPGQFAIGRVTRKILNFAYQPALWIVN
ncbi:MAG: universal stress protein [Desulfobacterales bacterium]|nr:MAG: universal stress protein [Desulfobacterales bacterium]